MTEREEYLKNEAAFQDLKVETGVRQAQENYYGDKASLYMFSFRQEQIGDVAGKKILDLGCGKGEATIDNLIKNAIVTAIDISPQSIAYVQKLAEERGLAENLHAEVMDAQNLQLPDNYFDIVIGGGILHHLPELKKVMQEISRVLKPEGYAVFHEPLGMNPFLNLYRTLTPGKRTKDECPLNVSHLNVIREVFPNTEFTFFDCTTLISKVFIAMKLNKFANKLQDSLISLDRKLLKSKTTKITFWQKMSWIVIIKMKK